MSLAVLERQYQVDHTGAAFIREVPIPRTADLFVDTSERQTYPTIAEIVDLNASPKLSPEMMQVLAKPEVVRTLIPVAAKRFWVVSHQIDTAEIFRNTWKQGKLAKSGITFTMPEAMRFMRALALHDTGTVFTRMKNDELNPRELRGVLNRRERRQMKKHPRFGVEQVAGFATPYECELIGTHHEHNNYGENPYHKHADPADLPDEKKKSLFAAIDVAEAMANKWRLYKEPSSLAAIKLVLMSEFPLLSHELQEYIAEQAFTRRKFALIATPRMEKFVQRAREERGLWKHPERMAEEFVKAS